MEQAGGRTRPDIRSVAWRMKRVGASQAGLRPVMLTRPVRRLRLIWQRHRLREIPGLIVRNAWSVAGSVRRTREVSHFDAAFQVETDRIREIGTLDIESANAKYAVRYEPSPVDLVQRALGQLRIDPRSFTFVDFGAGKGRVLLLAAQWGFGRVIGVEFCEELVLQAQENIARFSDTHPVGGTMSVVCMDAVGFDIPETPVVCYFFNPFDATVLEKVVENIGTSWCCAPRDIYVVYGNPVHRRVLDAHARLRCVRDESAYVVYKLAAADACAGC